MIKERMSAGLHATGAASWVWLLQGSLLETAGGGEGCEGLRSCVVGCHKVWLLLLQQSNIPDSLTLISSPSHTVAQIT